MFLQHAERKGKTVTKEDYILAIVDMLNACNDIPLIDLIFKLLRKSA